MKLSEGIRYIDFHTHTGSGSAETVVVRNIMAGESVPDTFPDNTLFSAGIHPWHLTQENAAEMKRELVLSLAHPHVVMIGEAGFDRIKGPDEKIQYHVFCYQAELAEELHKPLVIHCVKGWDLLLKAHKELNPAVKWIVHGFRGNETMAHTLVSQGIFISLGEAGISNSIIMTAGMDNILPETDASGNNIKDVYNKFSEVTGISPEELSPLFRINFNSCFSK